MLQIICAICGKNQRAKLLFPSTFTNRDLSCSTYSARRMPDKIHYQINKCENCGLIFSSPILPISKIAKLYKKSTCNYEEQIPYLIKTYMGLLEKIESLFITRNPAQSKTKQSLQKRLLRPRLRRVLAMTGNRKLKILEIGCGNGFFLKALWDSGLKKVYGVEPSLEMSQKADPKIRRRIIVDIFRKNQFRAESFDVVLCFHTLDHLVDPFLAVFEMYRILKKGGFVLAVVHDTNGLSVKLFGESSPIFDIEHIYLFNKENIAKLFKKAGFEIFKTAGLVNEYPLWYWWRMSGLPKVIKSIGSTLLKTLGIENSVLKLSGGNLYAIARKP